MVAKAVFHERRSQISCQVEMKTPVQPASLAASSTSISACPCSRSVRGSRSGDTAPRAEEKP